MELSLEQIRDLIADALEDQFGTDSYQSPMYCIVSTFPDYVIARGPNADLYQIAFTVDENGNVTLGDPQLVQVAYIPVSQRATFLASEAAGSAEDDGWTWPVQIIESGDAHGSVGSGVYIPHMFTDEVVAQFAAAANGARFGRRHPAPIENDDDPARIAGWFTAGKMVGKAAQARLNLLKNETDLRQKLVAARDAGKLDLFGLSVLAFIAFKPQMIKARKCSSRKSLASSSLSTWLPRRARAGSSCRSQRQSRLRRRSRNYKIRSRERPLIPAARKARAEKKEQR
jgi:hypothetical protein